MTKANMLFHMLNLPFNFEMLVQQNIYTKIMSKTLPTLTKERQILISFDGPIGNNTLRKIGGSYVHVGKFPIWKLVPCL